jgi:hypothetical protein
MATRTTRTDRSTGSDPGGSRREARLAELVAELSSCDPDTALDAVRAGPEASDPLELVARAVTDLRHRSLEPQDRLRVAGFLRAGDRRLPRRARSGTARAQRPDDADQHLVHHGSLRRWERSGPAQELEGPDPSDRPTGPVRLEDGVIDLRDRTARFRRPGPGTASA